MSSQSRPPRRTSGYEYGGSAPTDPPRIASDTAYRGAPLPPPPEVKGRGCGAFFGRAFVWGAVIAFVATLCAVCGIFGVYAVYAGQLPSADKLATANPDQSTKIYDRKGGLLYEIFDANGGRHTIITPDQIPPVLKQATIATEDPSFYSNVGVDPLGVLRAIYYLVRYQRAIVGGSTVTQQLVKNALLTPEPTVERKIKEAILALEVTRRYGKDQILAFYLNSIYYGNLSYGIEAASQAYFEKDVSQLDLGEASLLAGLPQAPAIYDPCVNPDLALQRQKIVLDLMTKENYVTQAQADAASTEMTTRLAADDFSKKCGAGLTHGAAPHFVEFVRAQLEQEYGPEVVYKGGLQVYTTLDPDLQNIVEEEARKQIAAIKSKNVNSAAAVAANPKTGEIYAMLGSVDFDDKTIDGQVNVTTRLRQPGSSIKPINYVTALEKGWTPATPILDIRTEFPNGSQPPYVPVNYDGKEHGLVTVRTALANSLNVPAVKTLDFVGVPDMIKTAQQFGITSLNDPNRYGLALTLGGGEVELLELTGAYAVFANAGQRTEFTQISTGEKTTLTPFRKIVDGQGRTLLDNEEGAPPTEQVIDPRYAYLITNILSDNAARTPSFGANSPLKVSRPAFVKTGTTNDFKDNWTLGGTNELVIGVWVGNPRNQAMKGVTGITGAAPIWHNVLERAFKEDDLLKNIAAHDFPIPQGLVQAEVCNESGLIPTENCPGDHRHNEIFLNNQAPNQADDVWVKLKIDKTNNLLANDSCPPDIVEERVFAKLHEDVALPYDRVKEWGNANGYPAPPTDSSPCTNTAPQPTDEPIPDVGVQVHINHPNDGDRVNGVVQVNGVAIAPDFARFTLEVGRDNMWFPLGGGGSPVYPNGTLAAFDSRQLPDGPLNLRLTVYDHAGNHWEDSLHIQLDNAPDTVVPQPTKRPPDTPIPPASPTRKPRRTRPAPTELPPAIQTLLPQLTPTP